MPVARGVAVDAAWVSGLAAERRLGGDVASDGGRRLDMILSMRLFN